MDNINYVNCDLVQLVINEDSEDDAGSDTTDSSITINSHATEKCLLIRNGNVNQSDIIYRRISNYMSGSKLLTDLHDLRLFSSEHKSSRHSQNKSIKRFLFIFGFASTLIVLSQLYLTLYYDDASLQGWFKL